MLYGELRLSDTESIQAYMNSQILGNDAHATVVPRPFLLLPETA